MDQGYWSVSRTTVLRVRLPGEAGHQAPLPVAWPATLSSHVSSSRVASVATEATVKGMVNP